MSQNCGNSCQLCSSECQRTTVLTCSSPILMLLTSWLSPRRCSRLRDGSPTCRWRRGGSIGLNRDPQAPPPRPCRSQICRPGRAGGACQLGSGGTPAPQLWVCSGVTRRQRHQQKELRYTPSDPAVPVDASQSIQSVISLPHPLPPFFQPHLQRVAVPGPGSNPLRSGDNAGSLTTRLPRQSSPRFSCFCFLA